MDYLHVHKTDIDSKQCRDPKEFDKIAILCESRATEALKVPSGPYTKMHCDQIGDIFRSMLATQRGIKRMLDLEGPIDPETVDALLLTRIQLEGVFTLCLILEDPKYVTAYVQDHWRKQYVGYLLDREETKHLSRFRSHEAPERQRLVNLGQLFGVGPAHIHTVEMEELGIPLPAGMIEQPIQLFPAPKRVISKIISSAEKKQMLLRLYAKYVYLCSFAHGLPEANLLKNMFDSRFPTRKLIPDSDVKNKYEQVVSEAYITSFIYEHRTMYGRTNRTVPKQHGNNRRRMPRMGTAFRSNYAHKSNLGDPNSQAPRCTWLNPVAVSPVFLASKRDALSYKPFRKDYKALNHSVLPGDG